MDVIKVEHLTKDYGHKRGVFDVSFSLSKGEVVGFLGPNGAGKTTTIRHLMGFIKPDNGATTIMSMNSWLQAQSVHNYLGYLPGEIAFPGDMTGEKYLKTVAKLRKLDDSAKMKELMQEFEINPKGKLNRMSKGMKQKMGIVAAFMHDPQVLILDEPTSGLDPLMQNRFVNLIKREKAAGKTILLSSHMFEEVENTCDRIIMIKEGCIVNTIEGETILSAREKMFEVTFGDEESYKKFIAAFQIFKSVDADLMVKAFVPADKIKSFISLLAECDVKAMSQVENSLEEYFMTYYGGENHE